MPLNDFAVRITQRNNVADQNVLTISAVNGLVTQTDYFNNSVASKDLGNYYLLQKGDFAYNKSYSNGYPWGAIKRLSNYETGVVSPLYICFRISEIVNHDFVSQMFESDKHHNELSSIAKEGARNHGLLNIGINDFFSITFSLPSLEEQQKIADFLSAVDEKIELLTKKKALLEKYKKGVMQQLFSRAVRFKDEDGNDFSEWEEKPLSRVLTEHGLKSTGEEDVYSVSVHKGLINQIEHLGRSFAAKDTTNYNLVNPGDIVYTKSPTGSFPYGIIKQSRISWPVIVSPLYGVFTPETSALGYILDTYFSSPIAVYNYLHSIIQKGAKNTINISNDTFLTKSLPLPVAHKEQQKIADFLSAIDMKIDLVSRQIEKTKLFKKGLLQQMFV